MAKNKIKILLGENIRKYRQLRKFSQEKLAELVGLSISAMSCIERGIAYPAPETLNRIVEVLDVKPQMLFTDKSADNETAQQDFKKRYDLIKNDKTKFEILYNVLKVLS